MWSLRDHFSHFRCRPRRAVMLFTFSRKLTEQCLVPKLICVDLDVPDRIPRFHYKFWRNVQKFEFWRAVGPATDGSCTENMRLHFRILWTKSKNI